ncbi:MAG: response regulator [Salegentibacter sp.]
MNPVNILLVEDNEGDILLTVEALQDGKIANEIHVARDGREAINFLRRKGKFQYSQRPDLILLDINLPKLNGHELLDKIKQDEELKAIPVIILSTSSLEDEILRCYNSYANCYITKPVDINNFDQVLRRIKDFWTSTVELPRQNQLR